MRICDWSSDVCSSDLGDFVVSSSSYDAVAGRYRIQFQLYAADGSTRGAATEVASYSKPARGLIANLPAPVAMDADGNFTVIWNQASVSNIGRGFWPTYLYISTTVIHGRSYGADGVAMAADFLVHADLPDIVPLNGAPGLAIPALHLRADGNFI